MTSEPDLNGAVQPARRDQWSALLEVWEASVRATHHFLAEADIAALKPLILNEYFGQVDLFAVCDSAGAPLAFMGVAEDRLEMLFVRPELRGRGLGGRLARHAVARLGVRAVDVNEQNPEALAFYRHLGFAVAGRSPLDGQGRPFALLHMTLRS